MILKTLKRFTFSSLDIVRTRLEIASLDVKEARIRFITALITGAFAFLLIAISIIIGIFMLVVTFWETNLLFVTGILTFVCAAGGVTLFVIMFKRLKNGPGFFDGILTELERDMDAIDKYRRRLGE